LWEILGTENQNEVGVALFVFKIHGMVSLWWFIKNRWCYRTNSSYYVTLLLSPSSWEGNKNVLSLCAMERGWLLGSNLIRANQLEIYPFLLSGCYTPNADGFHWVKQIEFLLFNLSRFYSASVVSKISV
jgi:hypothetical protein